MPCDHTNSTAWVSCSLTNIASPLLPPAFMSNPCHVEMILVEKDEAVAKPEEDVQKRKKVSQKKLKRQKMKAALSGGVD